MIDLRGRQLSTNQPAGGCCRIELLGAVKLLSLSLLTTAKTELSILKDNSESNRKTKNKLRHYV